MNELQIFNNPDFGQVRMVMIEDAPYFVGKDVANILGYSNTADAIGRHVYEEDKTTIEISDGGSNYKTRAVIINESGVYALVFSSKLPTAKKFKRWVTSEVLPAIRKTGSYSKPKSQLELLVESAQALLEHERKLTVLSTKQDEQAKQIEIINKRIDMFNGVDGSNSREELRHKLNAYCYKNGIPQNKGWNILKQMYNDSYNTNISLLITNYQRTNKIKNRPTMPAYLEATGKLADAHAILDKLLN
jgi:prophage antirepressor-like protein